MKRTVEIFSAGCPLCRDAEARVRAIACPSCEVSVRDLNDSATGTDSLRRAQAYGIRAVPAVVVNGRLLECCRAEGPSDGALRAAGIGVPLS